MVIDHRQRRRLHFAVVVEQNGGHTEHITFHTVVLGLELRLGFIRRFFLSNNFVGL